MTDIHPVQTKYGYRWSFGLLPRDIELACFRNYGVEKDWDTGHTRLFHFEKAMELILPERTVTGKIGWVKNKWTDIGVRSFIEEDYQAWWGSKASGKTTTAAACAFVYYLAAPDRTAIQLCSTTKSALMKRIWGQMARFYQLFSEGEMPMVYFRGKPAFQYKIPGTTQVDEMAGIYGRALLRGSVEEAKGELIGVHNEYNVLIIDEAQVSRWAGVEAFDNLDSGREAKLLVIGNPVFRLDPLGRVGKPKAGWDSISADMDKWETEKGVCLHFDGLKSPGIDDPEKFWYLTTAEQIASLRKEPGENSPRWWTMIRGFIPPEGMTETVFTESLFDKFRCGRKVQWTSQPIELAALDGAFTLDGDRAIFETALVGMTTEGVVVIQFAPPVAINLELTGDEPIPYFVVAKVKELCAARGILPQYFGLDVSATQISFSSIFEKEWAPGIFKCQFGGAATGDRVSNDDGRAPKEAYHNRVTQLWYEVRQFAINGQISGMSEDAQVEACSRLVIQRNNKISVETKEEYKNRTSQSPDVFDAHVIIVAMARELLGMLPGTNNFNGSEDPIAEGSRVRTDDIEDPENMYRGSAVDLGDEEDVDNMFIL